MTRIRKCEWWPVFLIDDNAFWGQEVQVPNELRNRFEVAKKEFDAVQTELGNLFESALEKARQERKSD